MTCAKCEVCKTASDPATWTYKQLIQASSNDKDDSLALKQEIDKREKEFFK